jgi:hypothetical protein
MGLLYGRAGRLTAESGGFRPGQAPEKEGELCGAALAAEGQRLWMQASGITRTPRCVRCVRYGL